MSQFDLNSLYRKAFAKQRGESFDKQQVYDTDFEQVEFNASPRASQDTATVFEVSRNSLRQKLANGQEVYMPVAIGGYTLPNEPTVSLRISKTIERTALAGNKTKGTVKEQISTSDWDIIIRGVVVNELNVLEYPEDQVKELYDVFKKDQSLIIESGITNLFDIYRVVIVDFNLPEMIGSPHAQAYELTLVSDEDFDLEII
jgi:hypothetical protein